MSIRQWFEEAKRRVNPRMLVRIASGAAAVLLAIWMLTFLIGTYELTYEDFTSERIVGGTVTVRCEPVANPGKGVSFDVVSGHPVLGAELADDINADCDRYRTSAAGYIGLLAVPTAILGVLSLVRRPTRD